MNEKIKLLAEQADPTGWHKRWYSGINPRTMDPETEKFVKLIVAECANTCKDNLVNDEEARAFGLTYNDAVGDCAIQIKNHFGIEE